MTQTVKFAKHRLKHYHARSYRYYGGDAVRAGAAGS